MKDFVIRTDGMGYLGKNVELALNVGKGYQPDVHLIDPDQALLMAEELLRTARICMQNRKYGR